MKQETAQVRQKTGILPVFTFLLTDYISKYAGACVCFFALSVSATI